jgi:polyvinyl alcohol dehydrogenase (cytochrome)
MTHRMQDLNTREMGKALHKGTRAHACWSLVAAMLVLTSASVTRADDDSDDAADWPSYNHDRLGTRYNAAESTLGTANVGGLRVKWQFTTPAPVSATPVVVGNVVYAGDMAGNFYALKSDGTKLWSTQLGGSITASALVAGGMVVVGDTAGNMYGLKRNKGSVEWTKRFDPHQQAAIFGSAIKIGNLAAVGVASNEEAAAAFIPNYQCCSSRGSLVLFDPKDGSVAWQTYTVTETGASGASIWSTPTYDPALGLIYVTTGNNFNQPTTNKSDAFIAFDAKTGAIAWVNQRLPNDEWNFNFPYSPDHPDADFGDSPQIYSLSNGQRVVGAGQKNGFYHVLDAKTGATINQNSVEVGGTLGGLFADSAVAGGVVYANGVNWPIPSGPSLATAQGHLFAMSGTGQVLWKYTVPNSPNLAGVAVANSVVYFASSYSARLFALNASTGAPLAAVLIGVSISGPSVSRGQVYVGTGDAISASFGGQGPFPGSITALGL